MAGEPTRRHEPGLVQLPARTVVYVAIVAALVSAAIHLFLAPRVLGFDQMVGILFYRGNKASASGLDPEGEADT